MANILLIEDEERLRESMVDILEDKGHEITEAQDGQQGIDILASRIFDIIISDLRTPNITAINLIERLASSARGAAVIIVTGHPSDFTLQKSIEKMAVAYIEKPFSPERLIEVINDVLKRK